MLSQRSLPPAAPRSRGIGGAAIWAASGRLFGRLVDVGTLVVLARSLAPADFGVVAMAMAIVLLIEAATQMPLIQPILRTKTPLPEHYDMAFTLGFLRAVGIGLLLVASAPLIASFYGEPRLLLLLSFLALAPAARGLVSPRLADRVRAYDMRHDFAMMVGGKLFALMAVTLTLIINGSYWAIAAGTVTTPIVMCVISYAFAPYRPRFSFAAWSDFVDIIGWSSLNQVLRALNFQMDRLVLGRLVSPTELGRFSMATELSALPIQAFIQSLDGTMLAIFARAKEQAREDRLWLLVLNSMFVLLGPMFLSLTILAKPIIRLTLGDAWLDMAPFLSLLSLVSVVGLPTWILPPLSNVLRRADLPTKRTMAAIGVQLPTTLVGALVAGPLGAIGGRGLGVATEAILSIWAARTLTGLSVRAQLWSLRRSALGLVVFTITTYVLAPASSGALTSWVERIALAGQMVLAVVSGMTAMGVSMFVLWIVEARPHGVEGRIAEAISARGRSGSAQGGTGD